jgi:hypothetical protein
MADPRRPCVTHPVRFVVTDDLRRSRLTVLFRLVLAALHLVWLSLWSFAVAPLIAFQWLWAVFAGRLEEDVHGFLARFLRYQVHVYAYVTLLANPWPRFHGGRGYPVDLVVAPPDPQSRLTVIFRPVLALPAFVFASVLHVVLGAIAFLGWFASLALGRMPAGMHELGSYCLRYQTQVTAYAMLLTPAYPSLAGGASGSLQPKPATPQADG